MFLLSVASLKNRALIALITIVVAIFGGIALTGLKQELAPSVQFPTLAIVTQYQGAAPEVVNEDVSTPIETAIQGVPDLESTSATSSTGSSVVSATFTYGTNLATAEQKIMQALNRISSRLPNGADPQVIAGNFDDFPVMQIAVTSDDGASTEALAETLRQTVIPELADINGVREAALVGDPGRRVTITPDPVKLAAAGLSSQAISAALQSNGTLFGAGTITEDNQTLAVQAGSQLDDVSQIESLPLIASQGLSGQSLGQEAAQAPGIPGISSTEVAPVTIGDVATVVLENNPVNSISRVDGKPALSISVTKSQGANTVEVSTAVREALPELAKTAKAVTFTVVFDQAPYIQNSIETLAIEGLLGLVFAVLIILVFLFSIRATLVTAISIPTSVLITFLGLQAADYTLNILTLGALTIAIGRVVDDSIVVIENITRHLRDGDNREQSIVAAVREVAGAITASTVTTVAVFLPIAFVAGMTGELFRPFAMTVTIALLASLLVSLTIVPVLAYWFLKPERRRKPQAHPAHANDDERPTRLQRAYDPVIHWTLRKPVVTLLLAVLVLVGTFGLAPFMKTNFLGSDGQNTLGVTQTLEPGASLEQKSEAAARVEQELLDIDGVTTVQLTITNGASSLGALFGGGGGDGQISFSITTDEDANQEALQDTVRQRLDALNDVGEIALNASGGGFGASSSISIDITSPNQKELALASEAVVKKLKTFDSFQQVESNITSSRPYIAVTANRDVAAEAGLSEAALSQIVAQTMQPAAIGSIVLDNSTVTVYVATEAPPATLEELSALGVPTAAGIVPLNSLATVEIVDGPVSITTVKGARSATVDAEPAGDDLGTATADANTALAEVDLPSGVTAKIGGAASDQADAFSQLGLALLAAILIVYIVMVATFKSLLQPLILLVSVPFAATGAILLQVLTGIPLGVASLIGVLMLIGIVVTNAIVLVDLVNQYRARGMSVREAVEKGASRRLRPILMTALATIFALTPMAIGLTGHGGFISQPLAVVVIGGLISSTVLTLIVLPTLYFAVENRRENRRLRRAALRDAGEHNELRLADSSSIDG
ncbi:efflux RND transporter permease subunit [Lysinibacter cavernae]|uniref:HAE1 family hydrophobic/amphiphilic exporter-1 n=1 Tax=Lysinibacter cavernae TaxID=1640652 RepID=A0A7X5R1J6_9MICO|nr:HAE1 family hydrophobic/amphiphilic exporter-1 [Lysinibacter cavernae]